MRPTSLATLPEGLTLYMVRHGETDWNAEGRLQGGRDIPLNDLGRVQAEDVAHKLRDIAPRADDLDYLCSPMSRAQETMRILRRAMGFHADYFRTDPQLRELTFGEWEGRTWREVRAAEPERARAREKDKWNYVPPGGESYQMLMERIMPVLAGIRRDTVVVSHGGVMRAAMVGFGYERPKGAESQDIWQGRVLVMTRGSCSWR